MGYEKARFTGTPAPGDIASISSQNQDVAPAPGPVHLLIADETVMGCQLLQHTLARFRLTIKVVSSAVSRMQILEAMRGHNVDVALISEDLADGPLSGFRVLGDLRAAHPRTRVILLSKSAPDELVIDAFRAGAKGVFCRAETCETLSKCVQSVHKGQVWIDSRQLHCVLDALVNATPLRLVDSQGRALLTARESEVVKLVADGLPNRKVGEKLGLTEHTVSNYLFRIYEKLGISSRVELVLYAVRQRQE